MKTILLCICLIVISAAGCGRTPVQNDAEISRHLSTVKDAAADSAAMSSAGPAGQTGGKDPAAADSSAEVSAAETSAAAKTSGETAAAESVTLYVRHALWNLYVCQSNAESECFIAYDFH